MLVPYWIVNAFSPEDEKNDEVEELDDITVREWKRLVDGWVGPIPILHRGAGVRLTR
jgi:hypothetical protein